jgi:hypothetical protein
MRICRSAFLFNTLLVVAAVATLLSTPARLAAGEPARSGQTAQADLSTVKIVDAFNLFPNVGTLIYFVEPNDAGLPPGIISQCTGTLIHERVFLVAGHCTSQTQPGLPPFIKPFVTLSPNALDRSKWRAATHLAFHPSMAFCQLGDCPYEELAPGLVDIGLAFLAQPVRNVTPARLARPGTLEHPGAVGKLMVVAGYGFLNSLPGGISPHTLSGMDFAESRSRASREWSTTGGPAGRSRASCATAIRGHRRSSTIRVSPGGRMRPSWRPRVTGDSTALRAIIERASIR